MSGFTTKRVPAFGKQVHRLGLAGNYGATEKDFDAALERVNYAFWTTKQRRLTGPLKRALAKDRERYVVATGPTLGFFGGTLRSYTEKALKTLGTDYLDLLQLFWLGKTSALTDATMGELLKLKEEGKVHAVGTSIHDRLRAGRLAEDSPLDALMIRYNAAHPGAEREIFPHLARRHPAVIAYTATSWRRLLKRPRGWEGRVPTAGDCYRFCLSNEHVDVTLCGPASLAELEENLAAVEKGPLSAEELAFMREFGRAVHG